MAQGVVKKGKPATGGAGGGRKTQQPKKGARTIAPKRKSLVDQKRVTKNYTSGLTARTERNLAEKAGHLEMLAGGKGRKKGPATATGEKDGVKGKPMK